MFGVALTMASDSVVPTITTVEFQRSSFPSKRNLTPIKAVTLILSVFLKMGLGGDFPHGPVVEYPPYSAGDAGSTHGVGAKTLRAAGQLSPPATTGEPMCHNKRSCVRQPRPDVAK